MSASNASHARALHHLLLRQVERVAAERGVQPELHRAVAESLCVDDAPDGFEIAWRAEGATQRRSLDHDAFTLFHRGDGADADQRSAHLASRNERRAHELALGVLGLAPIEATRVRRAPVRALLLSPRALLLPAAVIVAGGVPGIALAAALLIWGIVDQVPRVGALLAVLPLATLAYADLPRTALAGGAAYALFQMLDPDPRLRWARVLALGAAIGFAAWLTPRWLPPATAVPWIVPALATAVVAFGWRFRLAIHHRVLPLALPWVALGLGWDDRPREALAVLGVSLCASAALTLEAPWARHRRERRRRK